MIDKLRTAQQLWEVALGELQLQVNKPNFDTWLKDTKGISNQDNTLIVGVPNVFVAEWLSNRLYSLISRTLANIAGINLDVQFVVHVPRHTGSSPLQTTMADGGTSTLIREPTKEVGKGIWEVFNTILEKEAKQNHYNARFTFDTFIAGECNNMAFSAAREVVESPGQLHNPLFIYGDTGLGKTHLLHAIAHAAEAKGFRTICTNAERFTTEFVMAVKNKCTDEFRNKFSNADFFLLDDLHFLSGKMQTLECVFHTFNELYHQDCQIVLASDRHPKALTSFHRKLRSRLEWGLVIDLSIPDLETRLSILVSKAKKQKATVPPEVLNLLATHFNQNVRELEGAFNRVVAYAKLSGRKLDTQQAMTALHDLLPQDSQPASGQSSENIIGAVASYFGLTPDSLRGKKRDKKTVLARHAAMYLLREHNSLSLSEIGRMFGKRDHSTVLHACEKMANEITTNPSLAASIQEIWQHQGIHKPSALDSHSGKSTPDCE